MPDDSQREFLQSLPLRPLIRKRGRQFLCEWGSFGSSSGATRDAAYEAFLTTWIGKLWAKKLASGGVGMGDA